MPSGERRALILLAARKVFVEKGLDGARTRDIAAEAGINEGLMYRHFSSKESLFEAAISAPLEAAVAHLVEASGTPPGEFDESGGDMRERTRLFLVDLIRAMDEISEMLGVALFRESEQAAAYYQSRIAPNLATVESVVLANLSHWSHTNFDTGLTVNFVFGAAWFHVTASKLEGRTTDPERVAAYLVGLLFDGLFRHPGK